MTLKTTRTDYKAEITMMDTSGNTNDKRKFVAFRIGQSAKSGDYKLYSFFLEEHVINKERSEEVINQLIVENTTHSQATVDQMTINFNSSLQMAIKEDSVWYFILENFNNGISEQKLENQFDLPIPVRLVESKKVDKILKRNGKNWKWGNFIKNFQIKWHNNFITNYLQSIKG